MNFKIVKSELIEKRETHVYTFEKQKVDLIVIDGKPIHAVIRPGNLDKSGEFEIDPKQEGLRIDVEDSRIKALVKVLKEAYGDY